MTDKQICQILSDVIAVANRPLLVNGEVYKARRGTVNLALDAQEALLELMARVHCRKVGYGSYECYEQTMHGFDVDGCLVGEINRLNNNGIKTIGCCCGHGRRQGYIQVAPDSVAEMLKREYQQIEVDNHGNGKWCFVPKTSLPKPCEVAGYVEDCNDCGFCKAAQAGEGNHG